MAGVGLGSGSIVKITEFDVPPVVAELATVTMAVPGYPSMVESTAAAASVLLTMLVFRATPFQ
jgi:hypothetical protein